MTAVPNDRLEELLAEALAAHDEGGEQALARFVDAHAEQRAALLRGVDRCREMGLLGTAPKARDFPDRLGEFRLVRRLGGGGMGVVYEAEQESLARRVALKLIRPDLLYFEGARERFRREIEAVARLSHPAVVPVLASGEQDGVPYYVMEMLDGRTVQEVCTALAQRDPGELNGSDLRAVLGSGTTHATDPFQGEWWQVSTRMAHAVGLGVRHAHLRGIVHRDIKPSNVMITPHGLPVLLDFGVASVAGNHEFTRTGHTPGSPAFMSPEQLRGDAVDERTDVYSLAATLWQMLALVPAFRGTDDLQKIRDGDLPSLRARNRAVPRELELVIRTAMDRDRERRYRDMDAFVADLQAVMLRRPIHARRLGLVLRSLRWCQRHRVAATLLATLLLVFAMLPGVFAWREARANAELAAARSEAESSLQQNLETLHDVLVRFGNEKLRHVPQAEEVTIDALREAVTDYRRLLPKHPDHEALRQQAGHALDSLAAALQRCGRVDEAIAACREGIAVLGGDRMDEPPGIVDGRAHLNTNLVSMYLTNGRVDEAAACVAAAERDFRAVGDLPRWRNWALRGRATLARHRADLPPARGKPDAIEACYRESIRLVREWRELAPDDQQAIAIEIGHLDTLATWLVQKKRFDEAEPLLEEEMQKARALRADLPLWPPPAQVLSDVLETLGIARLEQRDTRCYEALRECLQLREQLARDFPGNVLIRNKLGGAAHNLGHAYYRQSRDPEAVEQLQRARELQGSCLRESPGFGVAREYLRKTLTILGGCYNSLGKRPEVIGTAEELATLTEDRTALRTGALQFLRGIELLAKEPENQDAATLRARYARSAMDLLLAADKLGWGTTSRLDEPVYEPLQQFPEFGELKQRVGQRIAAPSEGK